MKVTIRGVQSGVGAAALLAAIRSGAPSVMAKPPAEPALVLDEHDGELRQHVTGAEVLARGSTVTIRFSAARADRILGRAKVDPHGALAHRIAYAVSFDGGKTFTPEQPLEARRLDAGAVVHEAVQPIPADATSLLLYARVKAILVADGRATEIADVYDNPGGAFTNYAFPLR